LHGAHLQKQLQIALILSVTFIWSHPSVGLNGLWFMIAFIFASLPPSPVANISGKIFRCPFHSKSALPNRCPPPQLFDASYAPGLCNRTCLARCSENGVYCITWPYNPRAKTFTCITVPMAMNTPRSTNLKAHLKRSASRRLGSAVT
jgi:hypothetical protein